MTFKSGGNLTFYKNGEAYVSSTAMTSDLSVNANDLIINGLGQASTGPIQLGDLDEYRLYNRELTAQEVVNIYKLSR